MNIRDMFKYFTEEDAKALGFTHKGSYYGVPVYLIAEDEPRVMVRWTPMDLIVDLIEVLVDTFDLECVFKIEDKI